MGFWSEYDRRLELFSEKMKFAEGEGAEGKESFHLSEGMIILLPKAVEKLRSMRRI